MRKPILYSIKIDVTNKDWCPIPALFVIAQPQKPGATHNKGGLQFVNTNTGGTDRIKTVLRKGADCLTGSRFTEAVMIYSFLFNNKINQDNVNL